jgi:hypothetical protein
MTDLKTPTSPNLAAKNLLAKLMATEDIVVEHDPRAQTASFNMESRVLILPVWKDLDGDTLDMLIGHEVSHALHTPAGMKPLTDAVNSIDRKNSAVAKDYLNVVEDARIERMIKTRFPGLKRSFATGYRDLMKRDLFGLKKIGDISALPLIDRINLQYKVGWLIEVPFTDAELALAQRVATTVTWDDVVTLTKEIYEFAKESSNSSNSDPQDGQGSEQGKNNDDGDSEESESDASAPSGEEGDEDGESESDGMENGDEDADEDGDSNGTGDESDEEGDEDGETAAEGENDDAEDGTEGGDKSRPSDDDSDAKDGESKDSEGETEAKTQESKVSKNDRPAPTSQTVRAAEDGLKGLIDKNAKSIYYADLPEIDKGFAVPMKTAQESLKKWVTLKPFRKETAAALYAAWKTQNAGAVQVLATEFDRRKAADAHKRMMVAETGSIDPNRLHAYRIAEDIFLQNSYVKDGKNHGLVLLLDMSGSMSGVFFDTMMQLVTLGHFCRRVNIPFAFYGFTDRAAMVKEFGDAPSFKKGTFSADTIKTRLVTLLQDGMKANEFSEACGNLLLSAYDSSSGIAANHPSMGALKSTGYQKSWGGVDWMCLDNTPTNAALLGLPSLMEEFKRVKRVQVMNLIVLTDGEPSDDVSSTVRYGESFRSKMGDRYSQVKVVWRDTKRRKDYKATKIYKGYNDEREYDLNREEQTALLLQIIRDRVGGKVVCIHLSGRRGGKDLANSLTQSALLNGEHAANAADAAMIHAAKEKAVTAWKDNDWISIPNARGFNDYIIVRTDTDVETDMLDKVDLNDKNAVRDLRKAFTKSMAATKSNRPLLTRVAELVSK